MIEEGNAQKGRRGTIKGEEEIKRLMKEEWHREGGTGGNGKGGGEGGEA